MKSRNTTVSFTFNLVILRNPLATLGIPDHSSCHCQIELKRQGKNVNRGCRFTEVLHAIRPIALVVSIAVVLLSRSSRKLLVRRTPQGVKGK